MGKHKRRSLRLRKRLRPQAKASTKHSEPKGSISDERGSSPSGQKNSGSQPEQSGFSWVTVEHRDPQGNPMLPQYVIEGTYNRKYQDVPVGSEINLHVLAGYKPKPLMMIERKIYPIQRLTVKGWRRSGQIAVEVEGWRRHEADWFSAMRGVKLRILDPGLPGPHSEESVYVVKQTSFEPKLVKLQDDNGGETEIHLHEGRLDIEETWMSAWRRQAAEVLKMGFKNLLLPLLSALLSGLLVWWIVRSPNPESPVSDISDCPPTQLLEGATGDSENKPSDKAMNTLSAETSPGPGEVEKRDSTSSLLKENPPRPQE